MPIKQLEQTSQEVINACSNVYKSCVVTMQHCFGMGGEHASKPHINLLKDCAEISKVTETFFLHNSEFTKDAAELCAKICERCAAECKSLDPEDAQMNTCAEFCMTCAEVCRRV